MATAAKVAVDSNHQGVIDAINRVQAMIEFSPEGTVITANDIFLNLMGYELDEIEGRHHRTFCDDSFVKSPAYKAFWKKLNSGEPDQGKYKRITKDGNEVWLQASYNPVFDRDGKLSRVIKFATDVTEESLATVEASGKLSAIDKVQAIIEFDLNGNIITANDGFLKCLDYRLDEIQGNHHSIFCEPDYVKSPAYKAFWDKLNRGEYDSGEYKRIGKNGKEVWIQASYNPILDQEGKPFKVVKFATDVTDQKLRNAEFEGTVAAINKAQAVIEFNLDGTVITANDNFLNALGYSLSDIQGHHHRMFCEDSYTRSNDYIQFWDKLNRGEHDAGRYMRLGKGGREVWIQASYNPIFDLNNKPYKVVKFATDITEQVKLEREVQRKAEEDKQKAEELRRKVDLLLEVVNAAAAGDLTQKVTVAGDDAVGKLAAGIENMVSDLRKVVAEVVQASNVFNEQADSIANGANQVANGSQNLGATIEEMTASVEELTASIGAIAESGRGADSLAREASEEVNPVELSRINAGSWINHNFNIWIGHHEDNRAWDYLFNTRKMLTEFEKNNPDFDKEKIARAWKQIYIAEGSDWCWWYGDDHIGQHNDQFDELYRLHLKRVYQLLGQEIPGELNQPINQAATEAHITMPEALVTPKIDGILTHFYEWSGAGMYDCHKAGGSMHRVEVATKSIIFAYDYDNLYIRLDFKNNFNLVANDKISVNLEVNSSEPISIPIEKDKLIEKDGIKGKFKDILEIGISRKLIVPEGYGKVEIYIVLLSRGSVLEKWPVDKPIQIELPERNKEIFWQV